MGLFAIDYEDVPGRGVIAEGGLKFRASEEYLRRYFAPILPFVSLNDLIGEAVFWSLTPGTMAVWAFPLLLYREGLRSALLLTLAVHASWEIVFQLVYIRPLNYLTFALGNRLLQAVGYLIAGIVCASTGHLGWTFALIGVLVAYTLALPDLVVGVVTFPFNLFFVKLPVSDHLLRLVGWYHARKHGQDPMSWTMIDERSDGHQ